MATRLRPRRISQRERFLAEFAKHGNIKLACEYARIDRSRHYEWLREDPEYAARFEEARQDAINTLEAEAHRRAVKGWQEPVIYQGSIAIGKNKKPVTITKFDSTLLIFLLKGAAPEKYRDTWKGEIKHSGAIATQTLDVSNLNDEQLTQLSLLLQAAGIADAETPAAGEGSGGTGDSPEEEKPD